MKYFYVGILILALLLAGCFFAGQTLRGRTEAVVAPLRRALTALRSGNESGGLYFVGLARAEWLRGEGLLASLLSHEHTAPVGAALAELGTLRGTELERACGRLLRALRALAETERLRWRNLF